MLLNSRLNPVYVPEDVAADYEEIESPSAVDCTAALAAEAAASAKCDTAYCWIALDPRYVKSVTLPPRGRLMQRNGKFVSEISNSGKYLELAISILAQVIYISTMH